MSGSDPPLILDSQSIGQDVGTGCTSTAGTSNDSRIKQTQTTVPEQLVDDRPRRLRMRLLKGLLQKSLNVGGKQVKNDVEMQELHAPAHDIVEKFLGATRGTFSLPTSVEREALYAELLKRNISNLPDSFVSKVFPTVNSTTLSVTEQVFRAMTVVSGSIGGGDQASIAMIAGNLHNQVVCRGAARDLFKLVFTLLGWITRLYLPSLDFESNNYFGISDTHSRSFASRQAIGQADRPLGELLRGFGDIMPTSSNQSASDASATATQTRDLHVSNLNAATLINLGGIKFNWTTSISCHLDFDASSQLLNIFSFPAFCEMNAGNEGESGTSTFHRILDGYYEAYNTPDGFTPTSFLEEVKLSYRLIFADDTQAQAIYRRSERNRAFKSNCGLKDPDLDTLCGMRPSQDPSQLYLQKVTYSTSEHFPIFSSRLLFLQEYILSQNPNKVGLLWKDRRDLLRWYTFWAVIIIGGLGIFFAIVQTALSAAQVALAAKTVIH